MATLKVLRFDGPDKADQAMKVLGSMLTRHLVSVSDAAVVTWPQDAKGPKVKQAVNTAGAGALSGTFWGMLIGLIFFMPLLGAAIGALAGAVGGALTDIGINDRFINDMRERITPGTSALLMLVSTDAPDRMADEMRSLGPELVSTNLSHEQEAKLRELFEA